MFGNTKFPVNLVFGNTFFEKYRVFKHFFVSLHRNKR